MSDTTGAEPERRLIAIDAETVERVRYALAFAEAEQEWEKGVVGTPWVAEQWQLLIDAARSILAAWDEGITREDVEAVVGPDMEYVTGDCSCARCNAQRALYTAVASAPQEAA